MQDPTVRVQENDKMIKPLYNISIMENKTHNLSVLLIDTNEKVNPQTIDLRNLLPKLRHNPKS